MKFTITEVDLDAASKVAVKVTFTPKAGKEQKRVFHFSPELSKTEVLKAIEDHAPEESSVDNSQAKALVSELMTEVGKDKTPSEK